MTIRLPEEMVERAVKVFEKISRDLLQFDIDIRFWGIHLR
jgi:hypothetical protein